MNRFFFTFILIVLVTLGSSFATLYQNNDLVQGYQTPSGTFVQTGTITGVNAIGYVCSNNDCSQVAQQIFNSGVISSTGTTLQTFFPNDALYLNDYGYGIYYYKDGYIPYEQRVTQSIKTGIVGDHTDPNVEVVKLSQLEMCRSVIDDFDVTNSVYPNQPVMIDIVTNLNANAYSPIQNDGPNDYIPSQIRRHYQVEIRVKLDVLNANGQVVDQQVQDIYVDFSGNKEVRFEYTPVDTGRYTARVTTSTTDGKCVDTESLSSQKDFTVINKGPTEQCFTTLQNLRSVPQYPKVGDTITTSVDKITSYYDEFGNLNPLATELELVVTKDGQIVHTETKDVSANTNVLDPKTVSFSYMPTEGGFYAVNVFAQSTSCPFNVDNTDSASQTLYVEGDSVTPVEPNKAPVWVAVPEIVLYEGETKSVQLTNYVSDPDGDSFTIQLLSQSNAAVASCTLSNSGLLSCTGVRDGSNEVIIRADDGEDSSSTTVRVKVLEPNDAPVLANLPDQLLPAGVSDNQNLFDLDDYSVDVNGDTLSYDIVTNTNGGFDCSIDVQNRLDCMVSVSEGFTDLTIVVTDGDLQDSDVVRITIDAIPINLAPTAQFPDVFLFANTGLNVGIFNVSDYVSDPENDDLSVQFVSESRTDIVDCVIHDDRFDCDVKDNMFGFSEVTLSVSDGVSIIEDSFIVVVQDVPNNAPIIENIPDRDLDENSGSNLNVIDLADYSSDIDGDSLSYRIYSESDRSIVDCSLSGSVVNCEVMPNQIGFSVVRVEVSDGQLTDVDDFIVRVNQVSTPNNPPVLENIIDITLVENGGTNTAVLDLSDYSSDADGDVLTYTIFSESDRSIVDCSLTGSIVNCEVMPNRVGDSTVRVEVSDGQASDFDSFDVTVVPINNQNNAPVIENVPDQFLNENTGLNQNIVNLANYSFDVDGDSLTYAIVDQTNVGVVDCSVSGSQVSCNVMPSQTGVSYVTVRVSDSSLTDTDVFAVYVQEVIGPNNAPVIENVPDLFLNENSGLNSNVVNLAGYSFDVDGDSLTYAIIDETARSIVDCSLIGSVVNCLVEDNQIGSSTVTVLVSDGILTDTDTFVVTVVDVVNPNTPPTADFPDITLSSNSGLREDIFTFDDFASDADGDTLDYTILSQTAQSVVDCEVVDGNLDCMVIPGVNGSSTVSIRVDDGQDSTVDSFVVSIVGRASNGAPSLNLTLIEVGRNSQKTVDLSSVTSDSDGDPVTYMIVSQSNPDVVLCSLSGISIVCEAEPNREGESIITMKMTDGFVTVYQTIRVVVLHAEHVHVATPVVEKYLSFAQVKHPSVVDVQSADIPINMVLRNGGDADLTNVRVSVMIPELGTKRSFGPFDLNEGEFESRSVVLPLYYQPEPGYYWIRFSVRSDEGEDRIMYREVLFK